MRLRELAAAEAQHIGGFRRLTERFEDGGITEVLLIRHGLTQPREWRDDPPLNDLGREQAQVLAAHLARFKRIGAVVSSPLLKTAEAIASAQGLEVEIDDGLREIESYVPEGQSLREILGEDEWEAVQQRIMVDRRWEARGKWFETGESIRARAVAAVDAAIERHPEQRIAIVTHGPVINAYVAHIVHSPFEHDRDDIADRRVGNLGARRATIAPGAQQHGALRHSVKRTSPLSRYPSRHQGVAEAA